MDALVRSATHASSWYNGNMHNLNQEMNGWFSSLPDRPPGSGARVIISPHAGYTYCGDVAASAYKLVAPEEIETVIVLGPSHVTSLNKCALSMFSAYATPFGNLSVDMRVHNELKETGMFEIMDRRSEETEHSIEMQMPFIAKIMFSRLGKFGVVPVLVGSLSSARSATYGNIFANYLINPRFLIVISSDFCHWGNRFSFLSYDPKSPLPIYEQISALDRKAMEAISSLQSSEFEEYLNNTQNTICGRHPISLVLHAFDCLQRSGKYSLIAKFAKYAQSNMCRTVQDSSVSYAAGAFYISERSNG